MYIFLTANGSTTMAITDPTQPIDYTSQATPTSYACGNCSKTGVKLWFYHFTPVSGQTLFCAQCAAVNQRVDISGMQADGSHREKWGDTAQIGSLVPSYPDKANSGFWSQSSVPAEVVHWWRALPNE